MSRPSLEGLAQLTRQLNALASLEEGRALKRAVTAGIQPAFHRAQEIIPVGIQAHRLKNGLLVAPGYAKSQLATRSSINGAKNIASGLLSVLADAYYVLQFVELGTRYMPAEPWISRSLLETRDACEAAFVDSIAASVAKAAATS